MTFSAVFLKRKKNRGNHVFYALEDFAAADDKETGICVMPLDTPLMSVGEDGIYTYRSRYEEHKPILYFNTFNNMWGTNFPQWQEGDYEFRFVMWGYDCGETQNLMERSSQLAEGIQLTSCYVHPAPVQIPVHMQLLNVKRDCEEVLLITRDLWGQEEFTEISMPGYEIGEVDYYGRKKGEVQKDTCRFLKRKYGLHIFHAVPREKNMR